MRFRPGHLPGTRRADARGTPQRSRFFRRRLLARGPGREARPRIEPRRGQGATDEPPTRRRRWRLRATGEDPEDSPGKNGPQERAPHDLARAPSAEEVRRSAAELPAWISNRRAVSGVRHDAYSRACPRAPPFLQKIGTTGFKGVGLDTRLRRKELGKKRLKHLVVRRAWKA